MQRMACTAQIRNASAYVRCALEAIHRDTPVSSSVTPACADQAHCTVPSQWTHLGRSRRELRCAFRYWLPLIGAVPLPPPGTSPPNCPLPVKNGRLIEGEAFRSETKTKIASINSAKPPDALQQSTGAGMATDASDVAATHKADPDETKKQAAVDKRKAFFSITNPDLWIAVGVIALILILVWALPGLQSPAT